MNESPEEQAQRLVEEWVPMGARPIAAALLDDLVRRLVPVVARLQEAEGLADRDYVTRDKYVGELAAVEAKLERAEAALRWYTSAGGQCPACGVNEFQDHMHGCWCYELAQKERAKVQRGTVEMIAPDYLAQVMERARRLTAVEQQLAAAEAERDDLVRCRRYAERRAIAAEAIVARLREIWERRTVIPPADWWDDMSAALAATEEK